MFLVFNITFFEIVDLIASEVLQSGTERVTELYSHRHRGVVLSEKRNFLFSILVIYVAGDRTRLGRHNFPENDQIPGAFQIEFLIKVRVKSSKSFLSTSITIRVNHIRENLFKIKFDGRSKYHIIVKWENDFCIKTFWNFDERLSQ